MTYFIILGLFIILINAVQLHSYQGYRGGMLIHSFKKWSSVNTQQQYRVSTKLFLSRVSSLKVTDIHQKDTRFVKPRIERLVENVDRLPVKDLKVGDKLRGRIISIVDHGLFVDVGSKRDGLVHIKDVSRDSFVNRLDSKFYPGQDIDVWVKFAQSSGKKIGLQLFPPQATQPRGSNTEHQYNNNTTKLKFQDLIPKMMVYGKVVRTSQYGVYVDIGVKNILAFLHKRKMKCNRSQWKYKPEELVPLGSQAVCYVHEVDSARRRVSLTTYPPVAWAERLVAPEIAAMYRDNRDIEEAERAQQNAQAYQRNLVHDQRKKYKKHHQQEEEEEYEDSELNTSNLQGNDEEDEGGETLTAIEIQRLTQGKYNKHLLDNNKNQLNRGTSIESTRVKKNAEIKIKPTKPSDFTTEELFYSISNNRNELNLSQLKRWVYIRELRQDGSLTIPILQQIFQKAGGYRGYLHIDQFELFLEIFADTLGLVDEDEYLSGTPENNKKLYYIDDYKLASGSSNSTNACISTYSSSTNVSITDSNNSSSGNTKITVQPKDIVSIDMRREHPMLSVPNDNLSIQALFHRLTSKRTHISYGQLIEQWEVFSDLVAHDSKLARKLRQSFAQCAKSSSLRGKMDGPGFQMYVIQHIQPAVADLALSRKACNDNNCGSSDNSSTSTSKEIKQHRDIIDSDFEEISVDEAFQTLSAASNSPLVSYASLLHWPLVAELVSEKYLSIHTLQQHFLQACTHNDVNTMNSIQINDSHSESKTMKEDIESSGLDISGFNALLDLLLPYASDDLTNHRPSEEVALSPAKGVMKVEELEAKEVGRDMEEVVTDKEVQEEDEEAQEDVTRTVFNDMAGTKGRVSLKDLLHWDFVYTLLAEQVLTEDELRTKIAKYSPGSRKGLTYEGFDRLVDDLVCLYAASDTTQKHDSEEEGDDSGDVSTIIAAGATAGTEGSADEDTHLQCASGNIEAPETVEVQQQEEEVEVDILQEFQQLCKDRGFVTIEDLQAWDILADVVSTAQDWRDLCSAAEVSDTQQITAVEFDRMLDCLVQEQAETEECEGGENHEHCQHTTGLENSLQECYQFY